MRLIDADKMLSELKPITYEMEQNAIKGKTWKCVEYFPEPPKEVRDDGAHIKPELW